mmetsp:Transcript_12940/g.17427  ORF Transcript_12940/g.17427 Transcript_12940/m.17427 type:complete len:164 (+) Transcript_12940:1252-1743(+)|eukprot:CAMPEP_0185568522 /NCGR_PEP_ID=MMETSP0434-20130131/1465_1 /TAXON_ID=626734 ORGANISM="Favella taraikaensis, Strain Fe Narragansett Bay" /NCGR_SAMPLE_ID=MMETSP0434 /ASSEMBLY_ACC=CAM_ASM_000379 /LENGTH=163 /DNA_ID=CAMNT_0028183081 /DNA_START=1065 /DNA_END=1556 /DNA_ORIENTATION=-
MAQTCIKKVELCIIQTEHELSTSYRKETETKERIERLTKKYVKTFRSNNPDLRHLKAQNIKDYSDILERESQNLQSPNSVILVAGGVLFIFYGTLSLSVLIARVFYRETLNLDYNSQAKAYLEAAQNMQAVLYNSMIDKLCSISGSVVTVLLIKPLLYGGWRQ